MLGATMHKPRRHFLGKGIFALSISPQRLTAAFGGMLILIEDT